MKIHEPKRGHGWGELPKAYLIIVVAVLTAAVSPIATAAPASPPLLTDEPANRRAVEFVQGFFRAADSYDFGSLASVFAPGAKIVLPNGAELDADEYIARRRTGARTAAPLREFSDIQTISRGGVVIVALTIRTQRDATVGRTRETWVLERTGAGFRALRAHYSPLTGQGS